VEDEAVLPQTFAQVQTTDVVLSAVPPKKPARPRSGGVVAVRSGEYPVQMLSAFTKQPVAVGAIGLQHVVVDEDGPAAPMATDSSR